MKINTLLAIACVPLGFVSIGHAATITLVNADFAIGTEGQPFNANSTPSQGWLSYNADGGQQTGGGVNYSTNLSYLSDPRTAGLQSAGGNYISQALTTSNEGAVSANTFGNYTVNLDLGYRCDAAVSGNIIMEVALWSGTQKLASDTYTIIAPTVGSAAPLTPVGLTLSYDPTLYTATDPIELRIVNTNYLASSPWNATALVDNVSVTATAIPEPSTYALSGGLAAVGVALVRRRRKSK